MIHAMTKKQLGLAVSCALAIGALSGAARAEPYQQPPGYLTSSDGSIVRSGFGLCVHADTGSIPAPSVQCDPNFVTAPVTQTVVPAPQPLAVVVPVATPEPAAPRVIARVSLDADALFDFDKSTLRPAGQVALDDFLGKMKGIHAEMITAFGYTDRIGTDAYNQVLSEQRVGAVRTYLEGKGVGPNNMHSEGRGNTQPITKPGECDGRVSVDVIACLQPDRRVEVEVMGTPITM